MKYVITYRVVVRGGKSRLRKFETDDYDLVEWVAEKLMHGMKLGSVREIYIVSEGDE